MLSQIPKPVLASRNEVDPYAERGFAALRSLTRDADPQVRDAANRYIERLRGHPKLLALTDDADLGIVPAGDQAHGSELADVHIEQRHDGTVIWSGRAKNAATAKEVVGRLEAFTQSWTTGQMTKKSLTDLPSFPQRGARPEPRRRLKDLPAPPEVQEAAESYCKRQGIRRKRDKARVEEELKLQFYYGGKDVICLNTPEGRCVIAEGVPGSGEIRRGLEELSPQERSRAVIIPVEPWDQQAVSTSSTSLHDE